MASPSICRLFWSLTTPSSRLARYCSRGACSLCRVSHSTPRDRHAHVSACPTKQSSRRNVSRQLYGRRNSAQSPTKRTRARLLLTEETNRFPRDAKNRSQSHQCAGGSRAPIGQDCARRLEVQLQRMARRKGTQGQCTKYRRCNAARCGRRQQDHRSKRAALTKRRPSTHSPV